MDKTSSITVFCGSRHGYNPEFKNSAERFGKILAENKIKLIYGGGGVGLMGTLSHSVKINGGSVLGIMPEFIREFEGTPELISELRLVEDMSERKKQLLKMGDAIVILPGGVGTLDELFEALSLKQLRQFHKPIILVNIDGYWQELIPTLKKITAVGFASPSLLSKFKVVDTVEDILPKLASL